MSWYFAYGSNMNEARVTARIGDTQRVLAGVLRDYGLRFNKASKVPGIAHANVVSVLGECVEGALFELSHPQQIHDMDPFEGYPHEYGRELLPIHTSEGVMEAWVYIGAQNRLAEMLKPAREYLEHLLAGRDFLSPDYHAALSRVDVVEGLDDATLKQLGLSRHSPR